MDHHKPKADGIGSDEIMVAPLQAIAVAPSEREGTSAGDSNLTEEQIVPGATNKDSTTALPASTDHPGTVTMKNRISTSPSKIKVKASAETQYLPNAFRRMQLKSSSSKFNTPAHSPPPQETPSHIFMATSGGVKAFSLATSEVRLVSDFAALGLAVDTNAKKLYMTDGQKMLRMDFHGCSSEIVFQSGACGLITGLGMDISTGNLYAMTQPGSILMFDTAKTPFIGHEIVSNTGTCASNIAMDMGSRSMFFTTFKPAGIWRLGLDGQNLEAICHDTTIPCGVTIDAGNAKVYWADWYMAEIQSCDMEGQNLANSMYLPVDSHPWGIAYLSGRIYWGNQSPSCLQSCDITGQDLRTHFTCSDTIFHLVTVHVDETVLQTSVLIN